MQLLYRSQCLVETWCLTAAGLFTCVEPPDPQLSNSHRIPFSELLNRQLLNQCMKQHMSHLYVTE